ncbi:tuftelin isoform X1 [Onychostruthus taczanowskii]|uniref:tuftelin isoform X1 n=2 Tax=Onychostruthus taczanowskii TaxID=356909 RepID=UPI001B801D49|nr:tuftelin isoform X1 [Onychostruthus taczanowskii]
MNGLPGWAALPESPELSMRRPTEFPEFPSPENSPGSLESSGGVPKSAWTPEEAGPVLRLRLPRDPPGDPRPKQKPVGRAFAMVAKRSDGNSLASECVKSKDGDEEIIKVYLKARADHEEPVTQLKSEVRHIQEAGSALKKLREDLSTKLQTRTEFREFQESSEVVLEKQSQSCSCRGNSQENPEDPEAPRLRWRLQEVEKQQQLERDGLERALLRCQEEAERADSARSRAEAEVEQLQKLLAGMEKDHRDLLARMELGQAELERLRKAEGERAAQQERSSQLEKEVAGLREKIHHLDDMLKSQQRKVRQMIEQLQNSKSVIQAKDAAIQELKERVSYLEAENLEMHDRIEHLIEKQVSRGGSSARVRSKSEYVSSKRLPGPKPLPLIRVVET